MFRIQLISDALKNNVQIRTWKYVFILRELFLRNSLNHIFRVGFFYEKHMSFS